MGGETVSWHTLFVILRRVGCFVVVPPQPFIASHAKDIGYSMYSSPENEWMNESR